MSRWIAACALLLVAGWSTPAAAQTPRVIDVPTRPGVTERVLYLAPAAPKAAAVLFTGGDGYVGIANDGTLARNGNFLVRSRSMFVDAGIAVALVDPPSDRLRAPYLGGFRQTTQHVADIAAIVAWLRNETRGKVWLIGTSRGTQSAAFAATQLTAPGSGPDGVVLTSTILVGSNPQDRAVPAMPLQRITGPVLVVHHEHDGCALCPFAGVPGLMAKLSAAARKESIPVSGGQSTGDPCEAFAYHGFNGIEREVVDTVARWIAPEASARQGALTNHSTPKRSVTTPK